MSCEASNPKAQQSTAMKIVSLVLITACVAVIGSAPLHAQSTDTQTGSTPKTDSQLNAPTHPGPNQWDRDRDWYARPGIAQGGYGWMGPGMMGPNAGWMMGQRRAWMARHAAVHRQHQARGARFIFQRGNARVDIQCPADQSLKDCVDAAGTLIDKVTRMAAPPPPPPPGAPKPPAGPDDGVK